MAGSGSPLSKTEASSPEECAITNGADSRPGSFGSLRSVSGSSRQPLADAGCRRPGLEKTVRPSAASRAAADHIW